MVKNRTHTQEADGIKHYVDYDSKYFSHDINAVVEAMRHYFYNLGKSGVSVY